MELAVEQALRTAVMDWVQERAEANGGFLHRHELLSFRVDGRDLPIIDFSRGIRNPAEFSSTLSIVSAANGPYDDVESEDGLLHYAYRKGDPWTGDNRKLRAAMETGQPLILFRKEVANYYTPVVPVYVVDDYPEERSFIIALDEAFRFMGDVRDLAEPQRQYAVRLAKQRLHQPAFRTRVLLAYATRCAVCSLAHGSLLDAAHIVPDGNDDRPASRRRRTASPSARSTTLRTTRTCSGFRRTIAWRSTGSCSRRLTGRCSSTGSRRCTGGC